MTFALQTSIAAYAYPDLTPADLRGLDLLSRPAWIVLAHGGGLWWANLAAARHLGLRAGRDGTGRPPLLPPELQTRVAAGRDVGPLPARGIMALDRPGGGDGVILDCTVSRLSLEGGRLALLVEAMEIQPAVQATPALTAAGPSGDGIASAALEALRVAPLLVSLFALDGRPLYRNPAAQVAYDDGQGGLDAFEDRFPDPSEARHAWMEVLAGRIYRAEQRFLTARGPRWHACEVRPTTLGPGGPSAVLVCEMDVNDQVANEENLRQTVASLVQSNGELEQFAWVTSHDLREPLRNVVSYLNLLAKRYDAVFDDDARTFMDFALGGAKRLDALTHDLLEYSSVGRSGKPKARVALDGVLHAARQELAEAMSRTGARLLASPLPSVMGEEEDLTRLFVNLIDNALKYRDPDRSPEIRITWEWDGNAVLIAVCDNGIGIAPAYFDKIFGIFQRLHPRDAFAGTGVGLALCRKVVQRHGGRIWVESAPGRGSAFFFTLAAETGL